MAGGIPVGSGRFRQNKRNEQSRHRGGSCLGNSNGHVNRVLSHRRVAGVGVKMNCACGLPATEGFRTLETVHVCRKWFGLKIERCKRYNVRNKPMTPEAVERLRRKREEFRRMLLEGGMKIEK